MSKSRKVGTSLAIAAAALMSTGCSHLYGDSSSEGSVSCYGANACKGHGSCATSTNACKGMNSCKGKGMTSEASKQDCQSKGGQVK